MWEAKKRDVNGKITLNPWEEAIRTVLLESNTPYTEWSRRSGVSLPAISRFANRLQALSADNLVHLGHALGLVLAAQTTHGLERVEVKPDLRPRPMGRPLTK